MTTASRKTVTLPDKSLPQWRQMVLGEISHKFENFVLSMRLHKAQKDLAAGKISLEEAVDIIYRLCQQHPLAVKRDLEKIF